MGGGFSARTAWDTGEGALAAAVRRARARGKELIDLTVSNPTVCGFVYDEGAILGALGQPAAMIYDPDPRGILGARKAVSRYYAEHGAEVDPGRVILTTSTSEAYSFLFRLLCDPGDEVLVAQPSYPLFDFLATLDHVTLRDYPLFYDFGWWIDFAELEQRIGPRTRAVVLVHPNNPTGHATSRAERVQLEELCARHGLALIVDEVFLDYGLERPVETFASGDHACLKFVVSGISKVLALPQMKVGWLACFGPEVRVREAMARLEVIADTFLSMNAAMQHALPVWLEGRGQIVEQIVARVRGNVAMLAEEKSLSALPVEAGWSAVLRLDRVSTGEEVAIQLVEQAGVVVHPGSFYGMAGQSRVVVSLLEVGRKFKCGLEKLNLWNESKR